VSILFTGENPQVSTHRWVF